MRSIPPQSLLARPAGRCRGFALVITLSLMILLALLAVGLLSLSAVSLRASKGQAAAAEARANARLAMMLAIGDLQKFLGPDQAVTARADLTLPASSGRRNLTGVWDSWFINPGDPPPNYADEKDKRFRQWLVSDSSLEARREVGFAAAPPKDRMVLATGGSREEAEITAGSVAVNGGGRFAWHVSDESAKARIDTVRNPTPGPSLAERRSLLAGHRPGVRSISSDDSFRFADLPGDDTAANYAKALPVVSKLLDPDQAELVGGEMSASLRHEVTTHSMGVLCDARDGGLKKDLTTAFAVAGGLPQELRAQRLYGSTHGIGGPSDPYWSALSAFCNLPSQLAGATPPVYQVSQVEPVRVNQDSVPRGNTPLPVILKFDAMFTVDTTDNPSNNPQQNPSLRGDPERKYILCLYYVPLITLHNPYNVTLEFERINILVRDLPIAFNFFVNGQPQNRKLVPFNEMWVGNGADRDGRGEKAVRLDLANWQYHNETNPREPVRMRPGQTLLFGPYLDAGVDKAAMRWLRGSTVAEAERVADDDSVALKLKPGFRGKLVGSQWNWLAPNLFRLPSATNPPWGTICLRWEDSVHVEMAVRRPESDSRGVLDRWEMAADIFVRNRKTPYGGMKFVYEDEATLTKYFKETWRYPANGAMRCSEIYEPYWNKPVKDMVRPQAVVTFSATARTANGGVYETRAREPQAGGANTLRDGRLAGKPFIHHNPARQAVLVNLKRDMPGRFSHELNFQPLKGETDDVIELDALNRGAAITGNTTLTGIKSAALFDLPTGPLQTLAGLRRSNALTSTYMPHMVQPVANSWVPALMSTEQTRQNGVAAYPLLDHSWLANTSLYDGYYFSTVAPRGNTGLRDVFRSFLTEDKPLPNQCYQPWSPDGKDPAAGPTLLFAGNAPADTAWRETAAWQMVKGPFNVNSTSVLAWKAMLASLANTKVPVLWARSLGLEDVGEEGDIPVPSCTLHLAGKAGAAPVDPKDIDNARTNEWNGYRTLNPTELDLLARRIVEEVKTRGPFLSMAEFVNRRLGYNSELTRVGALQAAIDKSGVNDRLFRDLVPVRLQDVSDPAVYGYQTPDVAAGNPADGAPGTICQGDLLQLLEPCATVRGDTFVIRTAGQALDANGKVLATAYAEAVVQRVPDFIDAANPAATPMKDLNPANRKFGRRFLLVSFRWMTPAEI